MVDVNQYYQSESDYLKADNLKTGNKYPMVISGVELVEFDENGKKQQKLVLTFQGAQKKMVLNKTNALTISSLYGGETDAWIGKKVFIFRTMVQFGDKMVDALRVDLPLQEAQLDAPTPATEPAPPIATTQPANPPADFEDDIPF